MISRVASGSIQVVTKVARLRAGSPSSRTSSPTSRIASSADMPVAGNSRSGASSVSQRAAEEFLPTRSNAVMLLVAHPPGTLSGSAFTVPAADDQTTAGPARPPPLRAPASRGRVRHGGADRRRPDRRPQRPRPDRKRPGRPGTDDGAEPGRSRTGRETGPSPPPGTQISRVEAGVLTYTVRKGSAVIREGESDQSPRLVRKLKAGQTARVKAGAVAGRAAVRHPRSRESRGKAGRHLPGDAAEDRRSPRDSRQPLGADGLRLERLARRRSRARCRSRGPSRGRSPSRRSRAARRAR